MSTTSAAQPTVTLTQEQFEELVAKGNRKTPAWIEQIFTWLASKHWSFHALVLAYGSAAAVVMANPKAHAAFIDLWGHLPKWGVDVVAIATPVVALAVNLNKSSDPSQPGGPANP